MKNLNLHYLGFLNTPVLWTDATIFGLKQIDLNHRPLNFNSSIHPQLRLGKLVERFVSHQLKQDESITVLTENIQIQDDKLTLGELDCLMIQNDQPVHLEIVFKFYLFDETVGTTPLDHWIGPNRKDSLMQKLSKLKEKQLPLLYHNQTNPVLQKLSMKTEDIIQRVCFKAQLFVPWHLRNHTFKSINNSCIKGFYFKQNEMHYFKDCRFYIPEKIDWLLDVQNEASWKNYSEFKDEINSFLVQKKSPLCWIKEPNDKVQKCFIVWW